jgi:hypothetical protein
MRDGAHAMSWNVLRWKYPGRWVRSTVAAKVARTIRRHWGVESELHWVLDMAFHEDDLRHRARNTAQNTTTLRHFALNVVEQDGERKVGIATCRKRAGWDRTYLIKLLTTAETNSQVRPVGRQSRPI